MYLDASVSLSHGWHMYVRVKRLGADSPYFCGLAFVLWLGSMQRSKGVDSPLPDSQMSDIILQHLHL